MGATPIRLLAAATALGLGIALAPALGAEAAPDHATRVVAANGSDVAALTEQERVLDATAQVAPDGGTRAVSESHGSPPIWLLVLLAPILLGGAIATGVTLRRLR